MPETVNSSDGSVAKASLAGPADPEMTVMETPPSMPKVSSAAWTRSGSGTSMVTPRRVGPSAGPGGIPTTHWIRNGQCGCIG